MKHFEISKTIRFEAAHLLPNHTGKCRRLHGHSWKATVHVRAENLNYEIEHESGMVMDFGRIEAAVAPMLGGYLDHHFLNDTLPMESPTSEEVARWIFEYLRPALPGLSGVTVEETCTSAAYYGE